MVIDKKRLSGKQKAAILLLLLGEDITAEIFKRLSDDEVHEISKEISMIRTVPAGISDAVAEEFYHLALARKYITVGGIDYAKKVLIKSMGAENGQKSIDRLVNVLERSPGFSSLEKINPQQLSKFILHEHPQTIALILAHLRAPQAAELISALPEDIRTEVIIRMANLEEISPDVVKKIINVLDQKLEAQGTYSLEEYGGVKAVSELFNRMERRASRNILEQIESRDPGLAVSIRDMMFVFEDILLIDDQGIMEILKRIDKKSLAMALKGSNEELRNKFFKNMSQRAGDMLKEEMEYGGPIRIKDVDKAQREIVEVVRGLEEEGVIVIGGVENEEYVI